MNRIFYSIMIVITLSSGSCEPDNKDIFNTEQVRLKATLSNSNETIALGDTMKMHLQLSDTIVSNTGNRSVQTLQRAQFYMRINKIDTTTTGRAILISQPAYWVTKGSISPTNQFSFEFEETVKPYGININFKPTEKGIYFFEVVSQAGQLRINNSYEARLFINFDVSDYHLNSAMPYLDQTWVGGAIQSIAEGFGVYVFKVN